MLEYYTIGMIAILAAISPGPDFAMVLRNSLMHHREAGILTAFGIGAGILIHTTYCVLGLALIISQSIFLFSIIKFIGAGYLIYLGIKGLFAKKPHDLDKISVKKIQPITNKRAFLDGFLANVLNPKCTLFMLSIFTLVVRPGTSLIVQISYGLEISAIAMSWFIFLSYALSHRWIKQRLESFQYKITKVMGVLLVGLGIFILSESAHS